MNLCANPMKDQWEEVWLFVPIDPTRDDLDSEGNFADVFAGALLGMCLSTCGLEHLAHALEKVQHWCEFQDALNVQPSPTQVQQAIAAWRASGRSFAPGEVRGIWVPAWVRRGRMQQAFAQMMTSVPRPTPAPARSVPRPRLRPSWA